MNTATRLMGGYASLRTSDSERSEKACAHATDPSTDEAVLYSGTRRVNSRWLKGYHLLAMHGVLLLANIIVAFSYSALSASLCSHGPQNRYSSARDAIHFEAKKFQLSAIYAADGSPNPHRFNNFFGPPRPEIDEEWETILGDINIRLPRSDMDQFAHDDNVVELADGSGVWNTMAVYHGLHCVKRLHHYIHKDYYYKGINGSDGLRLLEHTEHCLDWLRQYVQCNADTTLLPLHWTPDRLPIALDNGKHQCINWESLSQWIKKRSFDPHEPGLVVHPVLGEVFANGQGGDKIGITTQIESVPKADDQHSHG